MSFVFTVLYLMLVVTVGIILLYLIGSVIKKTLEVTFDWLAEQVNKFRPAK